MDWRDFHDFTDHRLDQHGGHSDDPDRPRGMDPERRPEPFKSYPEASESVSLTWDVDRWISGERDRGLTLNELSRILLVGAGAKRYRSPRLKGRYFRTYASAGALHPNEVYVAGADVDGLEAGLFHLDPKGRRLIRLGQGDPRGILATAADDDALGSMGALIVISGIPWRTGWKYGPRGYRHLWWDAGMIISNLLVLAGAGEHPVKITCMFDDGAVNELIGVDGRNEMALAIVGIGAGSKETGSYSSFGLAPGPLGPDPYEFREISEVHAATSSGNSAKSAVSTRFPESPGSPIERTIWKRGSTREFDEEGTISAEQLFEIMRYADQPLPGDWGDPTIELLLLAHSVDGHQPGAYRWHGSGLESLRFDPGSRDAGHFLSLKQDLGAEGVATIFPMSDLEAVAEVLGPRGYRAAQLEGAIRSGLIYLASYGLGFGATGLTFYDEEVSKYFGVQTVPMLEVAVGRPRASTPMRDPSEELQNLDLADATIENDVPKGWRGRVKGYSCEVNNATLVVRSASKRAGWCNVGQTVRAQPFTGDKIAFSAEVSTSLEDGSWAGLYVSVNGKEQAIAFDNMQDRPIEGDTEPSLYSIELPLDKAAESISFGMILVGKGEATVRAFQIR